MNLLGRKNQIKSKADNRHDEFKFHNVQGKEIDSVLDDGSDRYISDDEEEVKELQKNEKMQLKNMLMEPGTDYRDQLSEIVAGFPKVKKALNLNESVSEWHDSQGQTGSVLDQDEEAFATTEKAILNSYQAFLNNKHGEPWQDAADR